MAPEAQIEQDWVLVAALAADLHDAHARLVELVTRVLADDTWEAPGIRSPEHWLMVRAGMSRGQAAAIVLLARRQEDLPATAAALRQGVISLDQAAVVARHTPAEFDATVAEFARHATVTQLQRTVTRYDFTLETATHDSEGNPLPAQRPEADTGPDGQPVLLAPATLTMGFEEDGRFRLRYDAPPEQGALVQAALTEAKDHLFHTTNHSSDDAGDSGEHAAHVSECDGTNSTGGEYAGADRDNGAEGSADVAGSSSVDDSAEGCAGGGAGDACTGSCGGDARGARGGCDDRTGPNAFDGCGASSAGGKPRVTWADAFALMATRSLDGATNAARRSRYRVNVFLDTGGGWLTGQPRLPRHIVDGLTCEGTLTPIWTTGGHPVNVGDTQRVVPNRSRVLVLDRDRGCRFPGCGATSHVEVHHLTHWRDGGLTDLPNLLSLCPHHHDGHHRGEFTITGDPTRPDGLDFETRTGLAIGPPDRASERGSRTPPGEPRPDPHSHDSHPHDPRPRDTEAPDVDARGSAPPGGLGHEGPMPSLSAHAEAHTVGEPHDRERGGVGPVRLTGDQPRSTEFVPPPARNDRDPAGLRAVLPSRDQRKPTGFVRARPSSGDRDSAKRADRPRSRLGRSYPAPTGGTLHLNLVDFTPPRRRPDA